MNFAYDLWNEVIGMEKMESDPDYFGDEDQLGELHQEALEDWMPMEEDFLDDSGKEWGHRSTSMGDQMLVGNKKYVVAMMGFETLEGEKV